MNIVVNETVLFRKKVYTLGWVSLQKNFLMCKNSDMAFVKLLHKFLLRILVLVLCGLFSYRSCLPSAKCN